MKTALSIAGSDCSGGAGIQADLKTMTMNGVYAMTAITALTAQNTTGVSGILEVSPEFLCQQLDMIFTDIRPDAVKIGMVSSAPLIRAIAQRLRQYQAQKIVVDPVMVATSGARLIEPEAIETLKQELLPLAAVLTPNIPEAEILSGMTIQTPADMEAAATAAPYWSRAGTGSTTPTICCTPTASPSGSRESASKTPTPTAPAAPSPLPLLPTWPRALIWRTRCAAPKPISAAHWPPCWIWARVQALWHITLT